MYLSFNLFYLLFIVLGLDSRGFLFGPGIAMKLGIGFVPIRKQGKLPGETISVDAEKEYGKVYIDVSVDFSSQEIGVRISKIGNLSFLQQFQ